MSQHGQELVYEMMWDCKYCGQKKLLGLTHRFCAGCGAPQDPASRYFPPDAEKVLAKDHPYCGADLACPACKQPMSKNAKCCTNCGSPIDKGAAVGMRGDVVVPPPQASFGPVPAPPKKSSLGLVLGILGGVLGLILVVVLVAVFWKREGVFEVAGHSWERDIVVQRYDTTKQSAWCDSPPTGGREIARHKEQRGTDKVPDGETCQTRKKDRGNGTYAEVKECTPKTKEVPKMSDKCDYEVTDWKTARTLTEKGTSLTDAPRWPVVSLGRTGTCTGCEREGPRTETYTVHFVDAKSKKEATCDLPQAKWASFAKGSQWKGKSRVMTSGVDCDGLVRK
jgi:hypothetical protein